MTDQRAAAKQQCVAALERGDAPTATYWVQTLGDAPNDADVPALRTMVALVEGKEDAAYAILRDGVRQHPEAPVLQALVVRLGLAVQPATSTPEQSHQHKSTVNPLNVPLEGGQGDVSTPRTTTNSPLNPPSKGEGKHHARFDPIALTSTPVAARVAILVQDGLNQFLDDLVQALKAWYEVRVFTIKTEHDLRQAVQWGDVIWLEWCNEVAVRASRMAEVQQKPTLCRLHRYEAFSPFPEQVDWTAIDRLVLVTDHLRTLLTARSPRLEQEVTMQVIRNGVALDRFPLKVRAPGHHLAFVGYLYARKNPALALQILAELVQQDKRYRLSVAGAFQDPQEELYWHHAVDVMGLQEHISLDGWQEDLAGWFQDKHYFLSTSIHESFGYAVAEAMACGIKPVVHDFPFVKEIWPEEILFRTVREAVAQITESTYESEAYRAFIERHYTGARQANAFHELIEELCAAKKPCAHAEAPSGDGAASVNDDDMPAFVHQPGRLRSALERLQGHPDW